MKRKSNIHIIYVQIISVFLLSCSGNRADRFSNDKIKKDYPGTKSLIEKWQSDSLGCRGLRDKEMSENIIKRLRLEGTTRIKLLQILGKPNAEEKRDGLDILSYFFSSVCRDNKFIDSADYCVAEFTFRADRLIDRHYICL